MLAGLCAWLGACRAATPTGPTMRTPGSASSRARAASDPFAEIPYATAPLPAATFDFVVFDSVVIGVFVGGSVLVAQALGLQRAYWVPVSCLAVIAGATLRAVWDKQLQRILGTALGLLLAWGFMALPFNPWLIAAMVMVLCG